MNADMTEQIRCIIRAHGRLAVEFETLDDESDLYQAGLSSHSSVSLRDQKN
jgi:acyl carrier protein